MSAPSKTNSKQAAKFDTKLKAGECVPTNNFQVQVAVCFREGLWFFEGYSAKGNKKSIKSPKQKNNIPFSSLWEKTLTQSS